MLKDALENNIRNLLTQLLYKPVALVSSFLITASMTSDLLRELTAPNGTKYTQPLGLFINNEWVIGKQKDKIVSISPM